MRRSPLRRKTPLKRTGGLRRVKPKGLLPGGPPASERPAQRFWRVVTGSGRAECWIGSILKDLSAFWPEWEVEEELLSCDGPMDACHMISKQRIRQIYPRGAWKVTEAMSGARLYYPVTFGIEALDPVIQRVARDDIVYDERVGVPGCRRHHDLMDNKRVRIPYLYVPLATRSFAAEFGLDWSLERDFPERQKGSPE